MDLQTAHCTINLPSLFCELQCLRCDLCLFLSTNHRPKNVFAFNQRSASAWRHNSTQPLRDVTIPHSPCVTSQFHTAPAWRHNSTQPLRDVTIPHSPCVTSQFHTASAWRHNSTQPLRDVTIPHSPCVTSQFLRRTLIFCFAPIIVGLKRQDVFSAHSWSVYFFWPNFLLVVYW